MNKTAFARSHLFALLGITALLCASAELFAQDIEPRRWTQMPTGLNFIGIGAHYTQGDIIRQR